MKFSLILLMILALIFPFFYNSIANAAESNNLDCVWWQMTGQDRTQDNGVVTSYELVRSRNDMELSDIELVFISSIWNKDSGEPAKVYTKDISELNGKYRIDIYSGRSERIVLLAKIRSGEKTFYARTLVNGYGQSGKPDPEASEIDKIPDWPQLRISGEESYYRAQTGTPLNIYIENGPQLIHIIENNTPIETQELDNNGFYTYTPPHDEALSKAGYSAKNDFTFAAESEDSVVSLYLPIYRAYYGQISLKGGLAVIAFSASFCLVSVLNRGRRFRWN